MHIASQHSNQLDSNTKTLGQFDDLPVVSSLLLMPPEVLLGENLDTLLTADVVIPGLVRVSVTLNTSMGIIILVISLSCNIIGLIVVAFFLESWGSTIPQSGPFFFCAATTDMGHQCFLMREAFLTSPACVRRTI